MSRDTEIKIGPETNPVKLGREYERLRALATAGEIDDYNRDWCIVRAEVERRCRDDYGFKTKAWTYSWDHRGDCLRRLPSYTPSVSRPSPYMPRVVHLPDHLRNADVAADFLGIAG